MREVENEEKKVKNEVKEKKPETNLEEKKTGLLNWLKDKK